MSKLLRLLSVLFALVLVAAACGSDSSDNNASNATDASSEAEAEDQTTEDDKSEEATEDDQPEEATEEEPVEVALADMSWEQIQAQAQEEGIVNWNHWYLQERIRPFVAAFTEETGIEVVVSDGDFGANEDKLFAEADRDTGTIDVMSYTFNDMGQLDMNAFLMPLGQLPDLGNLTDELEGVDTENRGIAWWGNQSGIAYDMNRVDAADLPQTFEEMQAWISDNPNGFAMNDPSMGGAGHSFIQSSIRNLTGNSDFFDDEADQAKVDAWEPVWTWFESVRNDIGITSNNADTLTRINDGEFLLGPAWEDQLAGLQKEGQIGENVGFYIPEFGMNGGANSIMIPSNAEHPAAALVFIDWLTSPDTQAAMNENFGVAPQHPDASDEFALVPAAQRAFKQRWFAQPYGDLIVEIFVERIIGA